jgi:hypothetical protein
VALGERRLKGFAEKASVFRFEWRDPMPVSLLTKLAHRPGNEDPIGVGFAAKPVVEECFTVIWLSNPAARCCRRARGTFPGDVGVPDVGGGEK